MVDDYAVAAGDVVAVEGGAAGGDEAGETDGDGGVESEGSSLLVSLLIEERKRKEKKIPHSLFNHRIKKFIRLQTRHSNFIGSSRSLGTILVTNIPCQRSHPRRIFEQMI